MATNDSERTPPWRGLKDRKRVGESLGRGPRAPGHAAVASAGMVRHRKCGAFHALTLDFAGSSQSIAEARRLAELYLVSDQVRTGGQ